MRKETLFRKRLKRVFFILLINVISSAILLAALSLTRFPSILALGAIPIIAVGWFFNKRDIIFTTSFIYLAEFIFSVHYGLISIIQTQTIVQGIFSYSLFTIIAIIINIIRSMNRKIHALNEELIIKNKELEDISIRDHLTKLYNRRYAHEYVYDYANNFLRQLTTPEARKRDSIFSDKVIIVVLADIDNFKLINDAYGHGIGDRVLVAVSERLTAAVRFDDIIIRWGGEEFLLVCNLAKKEFLEHIVSKILYYIRNSKIYINNDVSIEVTLSFGATYFPLFDNAPSLFTFDQTILLCDKALYASKQNGRDQASCIIPKSDCLNEPDGGAQISVDDFFMSREHSTLHVIK
ncbi:MAG: GGDEF domain-containing protein [Spirochaetes bacterium]|nr:GGDEF domain-containing protein [Spirochaetota bacterium]